MIQYDDTLFSFTLFSYLKYCFIIFTYYFSTGIYLDLVLTLSTRNVFWQELHFRVDKFLALK